MRKYPSTMVCVICKKEFKVKYTRRPSELLAPACSVACGRVKARNTLMRKMSEAKDWLHPKLPAHLMPHPELWGMNK